MTGEALAQTKPISLENSKTLIEPDVQVQTLQKELGKLPKKEK
ncbi:MAG: hypothetical protein UT39_C0003G0046 [Candidatus Woesebacteria bacterium GW2011_GWA1_39_21]|uniref:Uncharacterized protein n=1 Tax=Candidatus Woesebacteria bacterium GW2011_GWA1_39_21 TaxID=1618550 RepID=A0A0G0RDN5_9BACT|nr:MAG: hypothetical protein UT39_C0003G0046 [Candidatus Woesebacteria bacterium GW2011_GWA1_39_21]